MRANIAQDGRFELVCTSQEAAILSSLLCAARPRGEAEAGQIRVIVIGEAAPAPEPHNPIEAR